MDRSESSSAKSDVMTVDRLQWESFRPREVVWSQGAE